MKTYEPTDLGGVMKKNGSTILANLGIFVAMCTVLVAMTLFFTEVSFSVGSVVEMSFSFLLLFFGSLVMYFSLFDTGAVRGRDSEEYRTAAAEYLPLSERVALHGDGDALQAFCEAVQQRELDRLRRRALAGAGICYRVYQEKYLGRDRQALTGLSRTQRRAVLRANRQKPPRLTPALLLSREKGEKSDALLPPSPGGKRALRITVNLLPSAVAVFFSVSVACQVIANPGWDVVILALGKLFTLLYNGVKGYRTGYFNLAGDTAAWHAARARLLREFAVLHPLPPEA